VSYADEAAVIADVERLAKGCKSGGAWSLPQVCFHLNYPIVQTLANPEPKGEATAQQKQMQGFIDQVIANGWPSGMNAPKEMAPPADPGASVVDHLLASLRKLQSTKSARVDAFVFGPVDTEKLRRFMLIHAAHHLSFFEPT
jgi:hypothetical protein